jgi:hypothetical protein
MRNAAQKTMPNLKLTLLLFCSGILIIPVHAEPVIPESSVPQFPGKYSGPFGFMVSCASLKNLITQSATRKVREGHHDQWQLEESGTLFHGIIMDGSVELSGKGFRLQVDCPPQNGVAAWAFSTESVVPGGGQCGIYIALANQDSSPGPHFVPWLESLAPRNGSIYFWWCRDNQRKHVLRREEFIDLKGGTYLTVDFKLSPIPISESWSMNPKKIPDVFELHSPLRQLMLRHVELRSTSHN